jgi:hypothetical protein
MKENRRENDPHKLQGAVTETQTAAEAWTVSNDKVFSFYAPI